MKEQMKEKKGATQENSITILLIEDNPGDARLLQEMLKETEGASFLLVHRDRLSAGLTYLNDNDVDLVLLDLGLPDSQGLDTYLHLHEKSGHLPIIVLTGLKDNSLAVTAVQRGAQDYLVKEHVKGEWLYRSIRYAIERKRSEEELHRMYMLLNSIVENIPHMIFLKDAKTLRFVRFNRAGEDLLGYSRDELLGKCDYDFFPKELADYFTEKDREVLHGKEVVDIPEEPLQTRHKGERTLHTKKVPLLNAVGEPDYLLGISEDITERKLADQSLRASEQRFRALFENMLNGFAYCEMLFDDQNRPVDFRYLSVNKAFGRLTGLKEVVGKSVTEVIPGIRELSPELFEIYGRVARTGYPEQFEIDFRALDMWLSIAVYSMEQGYFVAVFDDITERKRMEIERELSIERLRKSLRATVQAIAAVVEAKDPYTAGHQRRSADLARAIAADMGFSRDRTDFIRIAATIHDIGKIAVPAEILSKPTKLNDIEFGLIRTHSQAGYDILKDVEFPWQVADVILQHHERMDGSGYPQGLKGEDILVEARILAVADVVESMASHRPYRPALGLEAALAEVENNKETLYDADAVDACLRLFREKGFQLEGN